jgi:hypothetical protein
MWRISLEAAFKDDVGVVYSAFNYGLPNGKKHYTPYEPDKLIHTLNCFFGPSFLIRREVWLEAGEHRGKISHDYDHWLRIEEVCQRLDLKIVSIPDTLCDYRVHNKRVTVTRRHEFDACEWQEEAKRRRSDD